MAESRKVDIMPQPDSLAEKLKKRRQAIEEEDIEGLQKVSKEIAGKKKKKNGNGD